VLVEVANEADNAGFKYDVVKPGGGAVRLIERVKERSSWGYFDYRMTGERFDDGYQSVPVNWTISSPRKREFFELLSKVTGVGSR
jgi:hypothetical protein